MAPKSLLLLFIVCYVPFLLSAADDRGYPPRCPTSFTCEKLGKEIHFPFTNTDNSDCGLPILGCNGSEPVKLKLGWERGIWYEIRGINQTGEHDSFPIQNPDLLGYLSSYDCRTLDYIVPPLPVSPMMSFSIHIATLHVCNTCNFDAPYQFSCKGDDGQFKYRYYGFPGYDNPTSFFTGPECSTIQLQTKSSPNSGDQFTFLTADINITVILSPDCHECYHERGGQCRTDPENADNVICDNVY